VAALLDGQQAVALGQPDRGLRQPPADARPRRDSVDTQATGAIAGDLVAYDPQDRELPGGEPGSERRRHWAGKGQSAAAFDSHGSFRSSLEALGWKQRHTAKRNANGRQNLSDRIPAGMKRFS
jgi:hypothetical protein